MPRRKRKTVQVETNAESNIQRYRTIDAKGLIVLKDKPLNAIETIRIRAYDMGVRHGFSECESLYAAKRNSNDEVSNDTLKRTQAVTHILSSAGQYLGECARILMSEKNQL